ncbi:MAG TPA: hypothetical protein VJM69_05405 [Dehalococcoidia bacterium]|nr:hypothetical protein [Dehalococcoidia bacterium]
MELAMTSPNTPPARASGPSGHTRPAPSPLATSRRHIPLHPQVCTIREGRIDVHPSRTAVVFPLAGFLLGALAVTLVALGRDSLPMLALALLLLAGLLLIPLSGLGLVYSLVGAKVIFDRSKQSATWQQGFLGLGIGIQELVPFWKIAEIAVEEAGTAEGRQPVEELAQWDIVLGKTSGKRLIVGSVALPRFMEKEALSRAREVAESIAALTEKPLRLPRRPRRRRAKAPAP